MNNIWHMETLFSTHYKFAASTIDGEPVISVGHHVYVNSTKNLNIGIYGGHMGHHPSPAADLRIALEDFDDDFFTWGGCMFVSERMRQAMALDPDEVRFLEIDASQSAPLPRSKNYQIMEPLVEEDVFDVENSDYQPEPIPPDSDFGPTNINRLAVLPDAAPTHDLFYDRFFATILLCTDAFAMRFSRRGARAWCSLTRADVVAQLRRSAAPSAASRSLWGGMPRRTLKSRSWSEPSTDMISTQGS